MSGAPPEERRAHPGAQWVDLSIAPARSALLLIDLQRDLALPDGALAPDDPAARDRFSAAVTSAARALEAARGGGTWVIHAHTVHRPGYAGLNLTSPMGAFIAGSGALQRGSPGVAAVPEVAPRPDEWVVSRRGVSAFAGTDLALLLRTHGIDTVVLAGLVTHLGIEGTARDAADRGLRVVTLADACASAGDARHHASLDILGRVGVLVSTEMWCAALHRPVTSASVPD